MKFQANITSLTLLAAVTVSSTGVWAAEDNNSYLQEMVITGTKTEQLLMNEPGSITVIDQKQIKRMGFSSVAEMLRDVPGVQITDVSLAGGPRVQIRGERGARTLLLVDGQKISENKSMDGSPLLMNPEGIERIEVIKGPASVLYGSEAIGGVVNIITKKGGDTPIGATVSGLYNGSNDGKDWYGSVQGSKEGFNYRFSISDIDHSDRKTPDGTLENSSFTSQEKQVWLGYDIGDISLGYSYIDNDRDIESHTPEGVVGPSTGLSFFQLDLPEWSSTKHALFFDWDNVASLIDKVHIDVYRQETFKDFQNDMDFPLFGPFEGQLRLNTKNDQETLGGSVKLDWNLHPDHYLITGVDYTDDDLKANEHQIFNVVPAFPFIPNTDERFTDKANLKTWAVYIQDQWSFTDDWTATLGIRYTDIESELSETNDPNLKEQDSSDDNTVGSVGIVYSGIEDMTLRANWAQGYRYPNLQQLYIGTVHGSSSPTFANDQLQSETSDNFEIGMRLDKAGWTVDTALFYNDSEDYITQVDCDGTVCVTGTGEYFKNVNKASTLGAELFLAYSLTAQFEPYANITWMNREFEYDDFSTRDTGDPSLFGRIGLRYDGILSGIESWGDLYARGATHATEKGSTGNVNDEFSGWGTMNLSGGVNLGNKQQYRLSADFNNIFDKKYQPAGSSLIAPERHISIKVAMDF